MDIVVVIAYGIMAAAAFVGLFVLARVVWRKLPRRGRARANRSTRDRRKRMAPVLWDRRGGPRRLEDVAKGFLADVTRSAGERLPRPPRSASPSR
ncbi:MAG: hypothetical protein A2Y78_09015 [Acidobacteria bacterium RBG_13_68_16]|jgi:hypothetical protein|nr:MAG: hypothetical protein A2Y78_09015 [Acidobacteria bacterium RBG_13_68_16]